MGDWKVYVATLGTSAVELTAASPGPITDVLNQPGSFSFTIDAFDPQCRLCLPLAREAIAKRDGTVRFAGPIMGRNIDDAGSATFDADGLLAYTAQRSIDAGAERHNFVTNPQFEDTPDLDAWTAVNTTATVDTSEHILGTKSAKLVQAAAGQDAYLTQTVTVTGTGVGSLFTVVAWVKADPTGWLGEATGNRGLTISRLVIGTSTIILSNPPGESDIPGDFPKGSWQRLKTSIWVPPDATEDLEIRLYSPGGTVWWDAVQLVLMESLSSVEGPGDFLMDQATILENVVLFLQDPANGKSSVSITTDCPLSGVERERHYQFEAHTLGLDAIVEMTELENGVDVAVTPGDRTFRTYYRRKGTDRTGSVTLDASNVRFVGERFDGRAAASGVVVLGDGSGPDREEGGATDPSLYGGLTVEKVTTPRATVAIDTLAELAAEQQKRMADPRFLELVVTDPAVADVLETGDLVDVDLDYGADSASGTWRVVQLVTDPSLDAQTADTVTVTINPWVGP